MNNGIPGDQSVKASCVQIKVKSLNNDLELKDNPQFCQMLIHITLIRFVVVGSHARGTGALQVFEMGQKDLVCSKKV